MPTLFIRVFGIPPDCSHSVHRGGSKTFPPQMQCKTTSKTKAHKKIILKNKALNRRKKTIKNI